MRKSILFSFLLVFSLNAYAVNGFWNHGIGTKNKGMAGAGVALGEDAISGALNPANMVHQGTRMDFGASVFHVERGFTAHDDGDPNLRGRPGNYESSIEVFLLPQFGFNYQIDEKSSIGIVTVLGGGNSRYHSPAFEDFLSGLDGVNGLTVEQGTDTVGTDFFQLYLHFPYSRRITDKLSVGISPILAAESMRLRGLEPFKTVSSHPNEVTGKGWEIAFGYGANIGLRYQASERWSFGFNAQSRINMQKFDKYKGVIADDGNLDIPENFQVGAAFKVTPDVTLLADFQKIYYSNVNATGNDNDFGTNPANYLGNLGSTSSAGPGWDDANIRKFGARWQYDKDTVLRAGYSRMNQIVSDTHLLVNLLAPLAAQEHYSIGATRQLENGHELSASLTYSPRETPTGTNPVSQQTTDLFLEQVEFEITYGWRF